ncbi:MAG: hypothetical protein HC941_21910 [Microcoleus sp. SU_5_3]|nr:hypothetical protein [Microcoleus sp. SU_5_3]
MNVVFAYLIISQLAVKQSSSWQLAVVTELVEVLTVDIWLLLSITNYQLRITNHHQ